MDSRLGARRSARRAAGHRRRRRRARPTGYRQPVRATTFPTSATRVELRARLFVEEKHRDAFDSNRVAVTAVGVCRRPARAARRRRQRPRACDARRRRRSSRVHDANVDVLTASASTSSPATRASPGASSTRSSRPTSSIRSTCRGSSSRGEARPRLPVLLVRGALASVRRRSDRRGRLRAGLPARPLRSARRAVVAVQPARCRACRRIPRSAWRSAARRSRCRSTIRHPPFTLATRRAGRACRRPPAASTGACRRFAASSRSGCIRLDSAAASITPAPPSMTLDYPRFTMIGADFESVRGKWGMRGEAAVFVDDNFQSPRPADRARAVPSTPASGVDRRAGDYTLSGTVLVHSESYDAPLVHRDDAGSDGRTDVSLVALGRSDVCARELPASDVCRLQRVRAVRRSCAASASPTCATTSRSRRRSAGSPGSGDEPDRPVQRQRLRVRHG